MSFTKISAQFQFCPNLNLKFKFGHLNTFDRFLRVCAARTGQILNLSEISRDVGVSVPTIKKWRDLAGEEAAQGIIVANIDEQMEVSGCRAISWKNVL